MYGCNQPVQHKRWSSRSAKRRYDEHISKNMSMNAMDPGRHSSSADVGVGGYRPYFVSIYE